MLTQSRAAEAATRRHALDEAPMRARLYDAISTRAVKFSGAENIVGPHGDELLWIIDLRATLFRPEILEAVADLFWSRMSAHLPFQICGLETGSVPLVTAILLRARALGIDVSGFVVRKERKSTGLAHNIEGEVAELPITIIDDIFNSGSSVRKVLAVLDEIGRSATHVFTVIDYGSDSGRQLLAESGLQLEALFEPGQFGLSTGSRGWTRPICRGRQILWRFRGPPANPFNVVPRSAPVVCGDRVLYATDDGHLWCLSTTSGEALWTFKVQNQGIKNIYSTPLVVGDQAFFGAYDGNVYAVDLASGLEIWRNTAADWVGSSPVLCAEQDLIVIGMEHALRKRRGSIAALRRSTGELVWNLEIGHYVHATGAYAASLGAVGIGANDAVFRCLDAATGRVNWATPLHGMVRQGSIFAEELGMFFCASADGSLYGLDGRTGAIRWRYRTENSIDATPCLVDDLIAIGSTDKCLHVVHADTGTLFKKRDLSAKIYATPRLLGLKLLVGTTEGRLLAFDRTRFRLNADYQFHDRITTAVAFDVPKNLVFVPFLDNSLTAARLQILN
jgi:outer membrane protein assembly factor BamB/orotate phosphoribosyltransferase